MGLKENVLLGDNENTMCWTFLLKNVLGFLFLYWMFLGYVSLTQTGINPTAQLPLVSTGKLCLYICIHVRGITP